MKTPREVTSRMLNAVERDLAAGLSVHGVDDPADAKPRDMFSYRLGYWAALRDLEDALGIETTSTYTKEETR